jgi:WD40 repeat protein
MPDTHCEQLTISDLGTYAARLERDGRITVWNLLSGEAVLRESLSPIEDHPVYVDRDRLVMTENGRYLIGLSDGTLMAWDLFERGVAWQCADNVRGVLIKSSTNDYILIKNGYTIGVRSVIDGSYRGEFTTEDVIRCATITADGQFVVTGDSRGYVHFLRREDSAS